MAWITRLTETDYSVVRREGLVVFCDHKNQRAYQLEPEGMRIILKTIGPLQPDRVWIGIAINQGLIPHPFDEYV